MLQQEWKGRGGFARALQDLGLRVRPPSARRTEEEFRIQEQRHADLGEYRFQFCGIYPVQHLSRFKRGEDMVDFGLDRWIERNAPHLFLEGHAECGKSAGGNIQPHDQITDGSDGHNSPLIAAQALRVV